MAGPSGDGLEAERIASIVTGALEPAERAGVHTPRRTWLSCEETEQRAGEGGAKDHGWVFEVPADLRGVVDPQPITAKSGRSMIPGS